MENTEHVENASQYVANFISGRRFTRRLPRFLEMAIICRNGRFLSEESHTNLPRVVLPTLLLGCSGSGAGGSVTTSPEPAIHPVGACHTHFGDLVFM